MNILESFHNLLDIGMRELMHLGVTDFITVAFFYALSAITLFAGWSVITRKNIVHSALFLTLSFISVGCLYFTLSAEFLGAVQFLLYGSAVAIIIALGIMLITRENMALSNPSRSFRHRLSAGVLTFIFFMILSISIIFTPFDLEIRSFFGNTVFNLADLMLFNYTIAFELVAVLLLVALMGAIFLARGGDEK